MQDELLQNFDERKIIHKGHFVLSCGRHSDTFISITKLTSDPLFLNNLATQAVNKLTVQSVDIVAVPALSGILFGGFVAIKLKTQFIFAERVEDEMIFRRGFDAYIKKGVRVLVADDVITTGRTIKDIKTCIERLGGTVVGYITLWQREKIQNIENITSLITQELESYSPQNCLLCQKGIQITLTANKHGQEFLKKFGTHHKNWPTNAYDLLK